MTKFRRNDWPFLLLAVCGMVLAVATFIEGITMLTKRDFYLLFFFLVLLLAYFDFKEMDKKKEQENNFELDDDQIW